MSGAMPKSFLFNFKTFRKIKRNDSVFAYDVQTIGLQGWKFSDPDPACIKALLDRSVIKSKYSI